MRDKSKARWRTWLGYGLGVAAALFAASHLGLDDGDVDRAIRALEPWRVVVFTALLGMHLWLNAIAFGFLFESAQTGISPALARRAWLGSLLAKYIPGGIWQIVGRGALLAKYGLTVKVATATGIVEQVLSLSWCFLIALLSWAWVDGHDMIAYASAMVALLIWLWIPALGRKWLPSVAARPLQRSVALYGLAMLPFALAYLVLLVPNEALQYVMALFAGTIAGALALFAPGGLGVREASVALLAQGADGGRLLVGMALARLLILAVEVVASIVGIELLRRSRR